MRALRLLACLFAAAFAASMQAAPQQPPTPKKITITGKLAQVMGIGGETTGWALQLKREVTLAGKRVDSIEISGPVDRFEELKGQRVKAKGALSHHHGVERGDYLVLQVTSIRAVN
jgi:hypothetical protein